MEPWPFSRQTLGQILEEKVAKCGDKVFLEFEDGRTATFKELDQTANRIANGLLALGLKKGDAFATLMPSSLESVCLWFGAAKAGIVEVPVNLANKGGFLSHIINNSESRVVVVERQLADRLKFVEDDLRGAEKVIVWSKSPGDGELPELRFQTLDYATLMESSAQPPGVVVRPNDTLVIIYTSGTTGAAKGVMLPHAAIHIGGSEYAEATRAVPDDVFFTCLPLFHANARFLCIAPALVLGAKVVVYERFSASRFWRQIRKHNATIFNSLGAIAQFIYSQPEMQDDGDNSIRVCMASPMPATIYEDFVRRYRLKVIEGYGLTEMAMMTYTPWDAPKIGSCGKETKTFEVRIVDENHFPVPPGTVGEIVARGRIPWAMALGYINNPEATVELTRNHYYHTGDAGYLDEQGYLFFKDRIKDYIRRRGENISSAEIEAVVNSHPKVETSAAIAVKSELSEDEVKVVVILKEWQTLTPEELLAYCVDRMPYFAVPRYVEYVESFPRTANQKVQKALLREAGITARTWDREKVDFKVSR